MAALRFQCVGFSLQWLPWLCRQALGPRASVVAACGLYIIGSVVVHRLSCSVACGIFPNQGSNSSFLYWQADSYPLYTREVPHNLYYFGKETARHKDHTYIYSLFMRAAALGNAFRHLSYRIQIKHTSHKSGSQSHNCLSFYNAVFSRRKS